MRFSTIREYDKHLGALFLILTMLLIILAITNKNFFDWAYARHQNQLSWYIRPLFIIPFCFFAYKRLYSKRPLLKWVYSTN
jgi:hypothetical protein